MALPPPSIHTNAAAGAKTPAWERFQRALHAGYDFLVPDLPTTDLNSTVGVTLSIGVGVSASSSLTIAAACPDPSSADTCKFYGATVDQIRASIRAFAISSSLFGIGLVLFIILTFIGSWVAAWKAKQPERQDKKPPKPNRMILFLIDTVFDTMIAFVSAGIFFFGQAMEIVDKRWGMGLRWGGVVGLGSLSSAVAGLIAVIHACKAY